MCLVGLSQNSLPQAICSCQGSLRAPANNLRPTNTLSASQDAHPSLLSILSLPVSTPITIGTAKMGKAMPTEDRTPITADLSKVRDGGISKVQPAGKENKTLSREDEVRLSGLIAGLPDRPAGESSKPEVIDLESGSSDEGEDSEAAEDDEDGDEDEEDEEVCDAEWEGGWEEDGDDITYVQLPVQKDPTYYLTYKEVFLVKFVRERLDQAGNTFHEVRGIFSHMLDANERAQELAQRGSFRAQGNRYKEHIHCDGTFHARAKSIGRQCLSIDVEPAEFTVRKVAAAGASKPARPSKKKLEYIVRAEHRGGICSDNERGNIKSVSTHGGVYDLAEANEDAKDEMAETAQRYKMDIDEELYLNGMYHGVASYESDSYDVSVRIGP